MQADRGPGTHEPFARAARIGNAILGGWLFVSAFLWRHSVEHMINDALVGAIALSAALAALYVRPQLRVVNVLLSIWLFVSLFVLPAPGVATLFNDLFVATLLFGFGVLPPARSVPVSLPG